MSRYDYECSKIIKTKEYPFYALIMSAMRQADDKNLEILKGNWPEIWDEFRERFYTPGGYIMGEIHDQ